MSTFEPPPVPTPWPNANSRLLGIATGLPVDPMLRIQGFSADEFERFVLEWVDGFLRKQFAELGVIELEVQKRGGAGDKGRDVIAWKDPSGSPTRRCEIFQCKRYNVALGEGKFWVELGKLVYFTFKGAYPVPEAYWIVARKGVTNRLQDLIDVPEKLRQGLIAAWDKSCRDMITEEESIPLESDFLEWVQSFPFEIARVKHVHELLKEHAQTNYHLRVFGKPLFERGPPPTPPSEVAPAEIVYIRRLYDAIAEYLKRIVDKPSDFHDHETCKALFERARLTFYSAEGLKELARDQMREERYFLTLMDELYDAIHMTYLMERENGLARLMHVVQQAMMIDVSGHELAPLVLPNDRAGICHHLANDGRLAWCKP